MTRPDQKIQGLWSSIHENYRRLQNLSETIRVVIYAGAMLAGIGIVITTIVYRATAIRILITLTAIITLVMAIRAIISQAKSWNLKCKTAAEAACREEAEYQAAAHKQRVALLESIANGQRKPLSDTKGFLLRNSETLWYMCPASVMDRKNNQHNGELFVTSLRVSFVSEEYPIDISMDAINVARQHNHALNIVAKTASSTQTFILNDPELAAAHVTYSVRTYHRQVDVGFEKGTRHIPQDVKTAVWQRDGGICVQCGANDYLEYDHIIPHSKGGANTVDNIQLLCRRCNLAKRDAI